MSGSAKRRGQRERRLGETQSAPSNTNGNLETKAADLSTIKKSFSISTYLSPEGVGQLAPKAILHNSGPIDGALLACLALNEECRKEGTGVFYHLPPHQNQEIGHASDLIFMLKRWTRKNKYRWDKAGWSKRLDMYGIDEKCLGWSLIVAI